MYATLEYFGFDEAFIKWIELFNTDVSLYVLQCGLLSEPISVHRGCRLCNPISPYLFLIVVEVMGLLVKKNKNIKGISIGKMEFKITQFADDTTLMLDGSLRSLQATLNTLEIYGSLSGLQINCEKTTLTWIGSEKGFKEKLDIDRTLH